MEYLNYEMIQPKRLFINGFNLNFTFAKIFEVLVYPNYKAKRGMCLDWVKANFDLGPSQDVGTLGVTSWGVLNS
jgi:hypothetical protein